MNFTFAVEDFGKIKEACCDVADMTLFIGDNNSGKSYLMTLLYGLAGGAFLDLIMKKPGPHSDYFIPIIKECMSERRINERYFLTEKDLMHIEDSVNSLLDEKKEEFVKGVFNKGIPIGRIRLRFHHEDPIAVLCARMPPNNELEMVIEKYAKKRAGSVMEMGHVFKTEKQDISNLAAILMSWAVRICMGTDRTSLSVYLPASRTGFMLTYKLLISNSLSKAFSPNSGDGNGNPAVLTTPVIDFMKLLGSLVNRGSNISAERLPVARFIEKNILNGKIIAREMPIPDYNYQPKGMKISLPLHISSGVVTEITPLLLVIKNCFMNCLMIEEPEMCLHPALQRSMARVLIKIANAGIPCIVSTHSDIIVQHINNMLRLHDSPRKENVLPKLKYDQDDAISRERISVYQFIARDTATKISKIEWNCCDGFRAGTFIDSLTKIMDETFEITSERSNDGRL
jgi:predicted ATPase